MSNPPQATARNYRFQACLSGDALRNLLNKLGLGTDILALSGAPYRTCATARIFWLVTDLANPATYGVILDEIGYMSHQVTVISYLKFGIQWNDLIGHCPWLHTARSVVVQLYGEGELHADDITGTTEHTLGSTQFIVNLADNPDTLKLSTNTKRNIKKTAGQCTVLQMDSEESIDKYIALVSQSDARRDTLGRKNSPHQHEGLRQSIKAGCTSLYFAQCGDEIASALRVDMFGDRAYYIMGGSSPQGFSIGASAFLIYSVMQSLYKSHFKSLTLGLANTDGLKQFKIGLGAYPIKSTRFTLPTRHATIGTPLAFMMKLVLLLDRRLAGLSPIATFFTNKLLRQNTN